jgi:hypothetical protein
MTESDNSSAVGEYISSMGRSVLDLATYWRKLGKISSLVFIFILFPGGISASGMQLNHPLSIAQSDFHTKHFATMLQPIQAKALSGSGIDYDEQIANTFTQSFTSMAYNVTAVTQVDSDGCGPAYLLNGLSNVGYWYQVGLAYNWNCAASGFIMAYEVFNSNGVSIFPINGGGGTLGFTGTVNAGDILLLNIFFGTGSYSGEVVMYSYDWNTGAYASETYTNEGASYFAGLSNGAANANGFFTGLMTEQYHSSAYYGSEEFVSYSNHQYALPSAWQWIDEYNVATNQSVFYSASSSPVTFNNLHQLHLFSSNGATEYADAYVLDTGADPVSISLSSQPTYADAGMQSQATFTATGTGGTGPYDYLLFRDNNLISSTSTNGAFQDTVNFGSLSVGAHDYYVDVIDSNGYPASSQSVGFQVANDPSSSITVDKKTIDLGQSDSFSSSLQGGTPSYTLTWDVNGQEIGEQQTSTSSTNYVFNATSPGNFTVFANLIDLAGFSTNSTLQSFTVNQDPTISWNIGPHSTGFFYSNNVVSASAIVSSGTAPYTYSWYLNGQMVSQGNSPDYTYSLSQMGQNKLQLNVSDTTGFVVMSNIQSVNYGYDFLNLGLIVGGLAIVIFLVIFFVLRGSRRTAIPVSS